MTQDEFKRLWDSYEKIPCYREFMVDLAVVPSLLSGFYQGDLFLLESANTKREFSRFTYFGVPSEIFWVGSSDPFETLKNMVPFNAPVVPQLGDFSGGVIFLLGYGASNYTGVLRRPISQGEDVALFMLVDRFLVLDNYTQKVYGCVVVERGRSPVEDYSDAMSILDDMEDDLKKRVSQLVSGGSHRVEDIRWEMEPEDFKCRVSRIKEMITDGEAIQVVFSQKVEVYGRLSPLNFYRYLRKINPSPYMFFIKAGNAIYCGSSPEVHLMVKGGRALMKPIAGTYPVGPDLDEVIRQLSSDEKERAEHLMLVDLARNDLYTHCVPETVKVERFMEAEVYSHVVHLVSTVVGDLEGNVHPVDLLKMTFPAGTVSGAPKVRAMEIIDELETSARDFYAGCVGYCSYNGNLDTCITIRSARFHDGCCTLRAGAGIVYDSVPEKEYNEVVSKLKALLVAMERSPVMEV